MTWADVVDAFNQTTDIHIVTKKTSSQGSKVNEVLKSEAWLKNKATVRFDEEAERSNYSMNYSVIDDGIKRLYLDRTEKIAQLSDSYLAVENCLSRFPFRVIREFFEQQSAYTVTELPSESNDTVVAYQLFGRYNGRVWVDARSRLPIRLAAIETYGAGRKESLDAVCDYEPIPVEVFSAKIPDGYQVVTRTISGKVIDEKGKPVADAVICASTYMIPNGRTNRDGEFLIRLGAEEGEGDEQYGLGMSGLIFLRAFKRDDPHKVAWRWIGDPGGLHQGAENMELPDRYMHFMRSMPGQPGVIWPDQSCEIGAIVLKMGPASSISGRVVDRSGKPVPRALVYVGEMEFEAGGIGVCRLGHVPENYQEITQISSVDVRGKVFARTNSNGFYQLSNLPNNWSDAVLGVVADGYVEIKEKQFRSSEADGCNFALAEANITIRGTVIDDYGEPLVGRTVLAKVDHDVAEEQGLDEETDYGRLEVATLTGSEGKFELTGLPRVAGLVLRVSSHIKPSFWEEYAATIGREFRYYDETDVPVPLKPGKKEYKISVTLLVREE
jgi:protocatechuate 3,4-dioxygenase beta subunit